MESELLLSFIENAEIDLPAIRNGILVVSQNGGPVSDLELPLRKIHLLRDSVGVLAHQEAQDLAYEIEGLLGSAIDAREALSDEQTRKILDLLAMLEASLLNTRLKMEDFSLDVSGFVEESFENLQFYSPADEESFDDIQEETEFSTDEEFEIDEEMLEVFRMEADDLLKSIGANLDVLARQPDNTEALWEIRRNAHTFKGAAGIVGFKRPSELAHRVEDLLDHMAENKIPSNIKVVELLQAATDCLKALTTGENSPGLNAKITAVYSNFDAVMTSPTDAPVTSVDIVESETAVAESPAPDDGPAEQRSEPLKRRPSSIVRVSLDRLDDLVKIIRGLVISRSVFEQRLRELDQQIDELRNSTRRLQSASSKFEIDFETSFLGDRFGRRSDSPVPLRKLDGLVSTSIDEFDTLEFDQYTEFHQTTRELAETTGDTFAINSALDVLKGNLDSLFENQRRLIDEMQEKLLRIRMVEFGTLSTRLNRAVRVTCDEENKKAEVFIANENLEIDTQILDSLIEPLVHLLRNAIVHGIEPPETRRFLGKPEKGEINLRIYSEETHIVLTVSDDGRGIAVSSLREKAVQNGLISREHADTMDEDETLELIFLPGLTTAEKLNLNAGRGVGMSIVKESVESRHGTIAVASELQRGTTFTIRMPLSLAVTNVLLVKGGRQTFAFPLKQVRHILELSSSEIEKATRGSALQLGGEKYPLLHLNEYLGLPSGDTAAENVPVLLIETMGKISALIVEKLIKTEEIVIKPLGKPIDNIKTLLGAAILGSGDVVPILDLPYLLSRKQKPQKLADTALPEDDDRVSVLIVDDSPSVRHMTSKVIANAGWQVITAKDGLDALEILRADGKRPDVILTDVEMPRMDGYELLASLKQNDSLQDIPVVMITSRAAEKHRDKAFELGVSEYVTKPYEDTDLVESIKKLARV